MHRLLMGVVGLGHWGPNLARNISTCPRATLAWLCDKDSARVERLRPLYPTTTGSTDIADLLNSNVEAIAIATPVDTHFVLAKRCLESGKHVLLEKPMTSSLSDAEELRDLAAGRGLTLAVDHTYIFTAAAAKIKKLVTSGELGKLLYWDSVRVNLGLFRHDANVLWDLAPHDIALMDYIVGRSAQSVNAVGVAHYKGSLEDIAYVTLRFNDNFIAHFHLNWLSPLKLRQTLIGGSKKMVVYDDLASDEKVKIYDKGVRGPPPFMQYRLGDMFAPHLPDKEPLAIEMSHFVEVIRDSVACISGADAGVRVIAVMEAAQKSIESGGAEVTL